MSQHTVSDAYPCPSCGAAIFTTVRMPHECQKYLPHLTYQPLNPNVPLGPLPLTEHDIRRIVREELARERRSSPIHDPSQGGTE